MKITRFASASNRYLHIGGARTALFNYISRQHNGLFLIRIEDTDQERSKKEFEEDILQGLQWAGDRGLIKNHSLKGLNCIERAAEN